MIFNLDEMKSIFLWIIHDILKLCPWIKHLIRWQNARRIEILWNNFFILSGLMDLREFAEKIKFVDTQMKFSTFKAFHNIPISWSNFIFIFI